MNTKQLDQARLYAECLVLRSEFCGHGSLPDLKLILAAIIELQALKQITQALPDAQRAA